MNWIVTLLRFTLGQISRRCLCAWVPVLWAMWPHAVGYNVDTDQPLIFRGKPGSYFGATTEIVVDSKKWILVGAIKDTFTEKPDIPFPGNVYACPVDFNSETNCSVLSNLRTPETGANVSQKVYEERDQLLGASILVPEDSTKPIKICAPNWKNLRFFNPTDDVDDYYQVTGNCFMLKDRSDIVNTADISRFRVPIDLLDFYKAPLLGFSIADMKNRVFETLYGAPNAGRSSTGGMVGKNDGSLTNIKSLKMEVERSEVIKDTYLTGSLFGYSIATGNLGENPKRLFYFVVGAPNFGNKNGNIGAVKCGELEVENKELRKENEILKSREVDFRKELLNKVLQDDKNIKHFLGLPSLSFLTFFLQFLAVFYDKVSFWKGAGRSGSKKWQEKQQNKPGRQRKLSMKEEVVIVMLKLRLGLDNSTLAVLFGVSVGHVSTLFSTWINFLAQILDSVVKWPASEKVRKHMPLSFKLKYPKTTSIIDCTELFIQKPKNCSAQASTWSNYKSHNTLKALVAIQPNGAFTFVSKFWSGNISDRKITIESKYLNHISPGDEVMADRGFQIRDLLTLKGAYLNMPPFTHEKRNGKGRVLTSKQILETRKIASLRIHVERAIRRLKSFKMLGGILPLNMKNLSSAMLRVAAAFCNFLPPLSKKFK